MDDFRGKIWVFEDIIDLEYQEKIKQTLLSHETNWFYNDNINVNSDHERRPCFSHVYYDSEYDRYTDTGTKYHENNRSHLHDLLVPLIDSSCKAIEYNYKYIIQGRSFLQLPLKINDIQKLDVHHVDRTETHLVVLYYVKDADGDTIIYNKRYEPRKRISIFSSESPEEELKELKRVTPKQGRVVIFDGSYYHTAEQPQDDVRLIINYNVI